MALKRSVRALAALVLVGGFLLTGCVPPPPSAPGSPDPTLPTTAPTGEVVSPELQVFYDQRLEWVTCGTNRVCAEVTAPIDWENPGAGTITLAMIKLQGSQNSQASLFTNPGGPGASGFDFIDNYGEFLFSSEVMNYYDIIGWDPRGVGRSAPISCFANDDAKNYFMFEAEIDSTIDDANFITELENIYQPFIDDCVKYSGAILGHVDTVSTAHDLDLMRSLVGDAQLHYLGFSYGAYLGAVYAEEHTDKVGRVVLDGPVNPEIGLVDLVLEQNLGFEEGYQQFLNSCLRSSGCPFTGNVADATQQTIDLLARLEQSPLRASDGRKLWGSSFTLSIAAALYTEYQWPTLREAIRDVMRGDADLAYVLIDQYHGRNSDGSFDDNSYEANMAINCLDYPVSRDIDRWNRDVERLSEASPVLGPYGGYSELLCDIWPYQSTVERGKITAAGSEPIVVVGSTFDTATPYIWAEQLADSLQNGVLLTREGQGHTSYAQGNMCIDRAVDEFLLSGKAPAAGTVC